MSYRDEVVSLLCNHWKHTASQAAEIGASADARIAELEAEVARRNQTIAVLSANISNPSPDMQERALKACGHYEIVTRLETDAARYRWLRKCDMEGDRAVHIGDELIGGALLDVAIDTARAGNGEGGDGG